jgi:streptogrisin D
MSVFGASHPVKRIGLYLAAILAIVAAALAAPVASAAQPTSTSAAGGVQAAAVRSLVQSLAITPAEAARRLQAQAGQTATADRLTRSLGARAAGAFIDAATGALVVNVLDAAAAAEVRAAGAQARTAVRSLAQLDRIKAALDRAGGPAGSAWAVDVASNTVVVSVPSGGGGPRGAALVARARSYGSSVRIQQVAPISTMAFYGGQAILTGSSRCTAGFITRVPSSGNQYILTAGHCTNIGTTWRTSSGQTIGPTAASSFPGNDFGAIRISDPASLQPQGGVLNNGAFLDITSAGRVAVGSTVCKTGSTTGTTCGRVLSYNTTVNYPQGTVTGLTTTNVCTQPGDSGGPLFAGSQAQGIVSGGTVVSCSSSSFRSFFQPADEPLSVYGLQLV